MDLIIINILNISIGPSIKIIIIIVIVIIIILIEIVEM